MMAAPINACAYLDGSNFDVLMVTSGVLIRLLLVALAYEGLDLMVSSRRRRSLWKI